MFDMATIRALASAYGHPVADDDGGKRFAALLRTHRTAAELRQEDVADRSGVSLSTISRWERGQVENPKPTELRAVCRVVKLRTVAACEALGYLDPAELADIPQPPREHGPTVEEIISIFENPDVPHEVKYATLQYLRWLRHQNESGPGTPSQAAS